ncbi:hypothetical protein ABII15_29130 [Streptomyces sp. HUAS MG91]|uniref:Histidine kinase n=1 Tax=Streptomyces tabacisoli TaxID=3156398 RepID=A0AAU8J1E7_9ACTN
MRRKVLMLYIAFTLLPAMGLLLFGMDRLEDRMAHSEQRTNRHRSERQEATSPRRGSPHRLRLIHGGKRDTHARRGRHRDRPVTTDQDHAASA